MKKLLILFCVSLLCGCQVKQEVKEKQTVYKDGTYVSTAAGYGGDFEVETIIKNDQVEDIVVKEHYETPSIGGVAIEQMIAMMKEENSADVDVISGATKTSQALKEAVSTSLKQAQNQQE